MTFLSIRAVDKTFGAFRALRNVSLSIERGGFVSLLGPSGCGKTTLLRIVAGLETPSSGAVVLDGADITGLPPEKRRLAMMFQSYALFPHMTALENVRFPLRMLREESVGDQRRRAREALDLVRLGHLADRHPRELSGGQQQRVALARAVVSGPRILLLDEPLSNLDARLREDMQIELQRVHRDLALTTLFVTHDQQEALSLSDRIILMQAGTIERDSTAADIYDDPGTPFAADFLGAANLLPAVVADAPGGPVADLGGGMTMGVPAGGPKGPVTLILRQEDAVVSPYIDGTTVLLGDGVDGTVDARLFLGPQNRYVITVAGRTVRVLTPRQTVLAPGDPVRLSWPPAAVRVIQGTIDGPA
ncbi:MAG: ABC transporter ATP-binding protein [Inquilinaceae bacterium]